MGAFKLGKMTFGSLFKKPETVLYPVEKKPQPKGLKGHIVINVDDCILCGMCGRSCPTDCIAVDKSAGTWSIGRFQCIQCGYCITVCPKSCLSMNPDYAPAATAIAPEVFDVSGLQKKEKESPAEKDPSKSEGIDNKTEPKEETSVEAKKDSVLEAKIAMMGEEKGEKVRKALSARR